MRARYIIGRESTVDSTDRGIAYGDGLFETMAVRKTVVQRLDLHLDRLARGCERLKLPMPDQLELKEHIDRAVGTIDRGYLKLILTRGPGERGYAPPASPTPTVILLSQADSATPATELTVKYLTVRLGENEKLAGIKHLNRLEQVLGRLELQTLDADEGLMLSTSGRVIGGTSRNLFAVYGDQLKTPLLAKAGIEGIMRRAVLTHCAENDINVEICNLSPDELLGADELFMTNALVGIQSVKSLDGVEYTRRATARSLGAALNSEREGPPERV